MKNRKLRQIRRPQTFQTPVTRNSKKYAFHQTIVMLREMRKVLSIFKVKG